MELIAELRDVSRVYQMGDVTVRALDRISVPFGTGEYWAIMGPSGSGKSTLLNVLGCIDRPTGGSYFVEECNTSDLDDDDLSRLRGASIGFIFQSFNLIPQLSVLENIMVPLLYQDGSASDGLVRAEALAERVGLADRILHRPSELSGGQQQRVAIARALINNPKIILADEATGNLDSQTASEILDIFSELNSEGKTILLVTHEESIGEQAQRVLCLKDGKVDLID
tara:strand:- start:79 stop:756 length:678 start_codon:yes stop_codon:yes gene_type:complete